MIAEKTFDISAGGIRVFNSDFEIKGKSYVRLFLDVLGDSNYEIQDEELYDIINDNVVFEIAPVGKMLFLQVATTPSELTSNPTDVSIVAGISAEIKLVADSITDVNTVSDNIDNVNIVAPNIVEVVNTGANINSVNIVADAITAGSPIGGDNHQFIGTGLVKGIQVMSKTSAVDDIMTVTAGTNAFSIADFTLENGASLTIEDGSTYKIL